MEDNKNFNANGQVVFIEPRWVTGETCLFAVTDPFEYMYGRNKLTKLRKEFVARLEKEGFVITYDKKDIDDDTVCLIMDENAICNDPSIPIEIYKKDFDKRMFASGGERLNYPHSVTVEEFFDSPFFPAVFKNELMNGGIDKFLIETPEQLEIIKKFYKDFSDNPQIMNAFNLSIFQQLIETPTNHKTYMRVLMSASGDVMGASLKYSRVNSSKREPEGIFEPFFCDENSEYFLNCSGMFNYYSEGGNISFSQPRYSYENSRILQEHGIDPSNPTIPEDVLEVASNIATKCNQELGIMSGIDFILNKYDNKWYYLEIQAFPAIEEWAVTKGIRKIKRGGIEEYIKYCELETEARHDALMMYMNKKNSKEFADEEDKPKSLSKKIQNPNS